GAYHWPGNVRELRNVGARAVMDESIALSDGGAAPARRASHDGAVDLPFKEAKERLVDSFTRDYLEALLQKHGGNITKAAKAAGIARPYVHKLVQKYGLKGD